MILALQCCPLDAQYAVELTRLICDIEPQRRNDTFCISCRRDAGGVIEQIARIASDKFENVIMVRGQRAGKGWPAGPNDQWAETMMRVSQANKKRGGKETGVLTFEPDCVPLRADWIDVIKEAWAGAHARGKLAMGNVCGDPPNHINGNAVFRVGLLRYYLELNGSGNVGWDVYHGKLLMSVGEDTDAIYQTYGLRDFDREYLENMRKNGIVPALFHGTKGPDGIRYVRGMLNDGVLAANAETPRGTNRVIAYKNKTTHETNA